MFGAMGSCFTEFLVLGGALVFFKEKKFWLKFLVEEEVELLRFILVT